MAEGTIWADQERARQVVEEAKTLKRWLEPYHALRKRVDEARELNELLESEPNVDLAMQRQLEQEADAIAAQLEAPTTCAMRCSRSIPGREARSRRTGRRC